MFNVGGGEVLVILVLALVVLGPDKLPQAARTFGKHLGDFRRISGGFRDEIANAMNIASSAPAPTTEPAPVTASAPTPPAPTTPAPAVAPAAATERKPVVGGAAADVHLGTVHAEGPVESFA